MYIKSIQIQGFRNFQDATVQFNDGVNVIIGHNNAGKSNLLKSLALMLDTKSTKRLEVDDFNKHIDLTTLVQVPPKVVIMMKIVQSVGEDLMNDDLVTVAPWLTRLEEPYEAILTYSFFLPEEFQQAYGAALLGQTDPRKIWLIIKHQFLQKYVAKIYGGNPALQTTADSESLNKFDFQFLNAIRDVERDLFTGRNTLLREVIDFFMDYGIKIDAQQTPDARTSAINAHKLTFSTGAQELVRQLQTRMETGRQHIMKYAEDTGAASDSAKPTFDGHLSEAELYSALRLIIQYSTGIEIPATHNGLGYNNLIFMSLLIAKMQVDTNGDYLGSNAKVFPILVIEEPEAHLHPAMQYKFLKFLHENVKDKARQVFITSHSTHITAAVGLDEIVCLHVKMDGTLNVGYPGKVFADTDAGKASKAYVERFLDATRSDMLFAKSVLFVEGIAEQLLVPTLAKAANKSLEDSHATIINIGGRYFDHFLQLFDSQQPNTIHKRVACITDQDPCRKKTVEDSYKRCYPFELNQDLAIYQYQIYGEYHRNAYAAHPNIRFYTQDPELGKTLEYELMFVNPGCSLLISSISANVPELNQLITAFQAGRDIAFVESNNIMHRSEENTRILNSLTTCTGARWDEPTKFKALLAARYLNSVAKGGNALELSRNIQANLTAYTSVPFTIPPYLQQAIEWTCQ